jgi:hypothetical protein
MCFSHHSVAPTDSTVARVLPARLPLCVSCFSFVCSSFLKFPYFDLSFQHVSIDCFGVSGQPGTEAHQKAQRFKTHTRLYTPTHTHKHIHTHTFGLGLSLTNHTFTYIHMCTQVTRRCLGTCRSASRLVVLGGPRGTIPPTDACGVG